MRLFVALDIEQEIRTRIAKFVDQVRTLAPSARWIPPESLHVTLKFIGERPDATVGNIEEALRLISVSSFQISFRGWGLFPTERSARVFWVGIEAGPALPQLAHQIESALVPLGIAAENRAFSPHLTLARAGSGSGAPGKQKGDRPNKQFSALVAKLGEIATQEFGTMMAAGFDLYRSELSSRGAQYTKIAHFPLNHA